MRWGSRKTLATICLAAVGCGWSVLWADLCLHWFPETCCPWYQQQLFSLISKISFEGHYQNLQRNPCRFKNLNGVCRTNVKLVWNAFYLGFPWVILWNYVWIDWLMQTLHWPLSDHSSMHSRWYEPCGTAVLWLTAVVHAMGSSQCFKISSSSSCTVDERWSSSFYSAWTANGPASIKLEPEGRSTKIKWDLSERSSEGFTKLWRDRNT